MQLVAEYLCESICKLLGAAKPNCETMSLGRSSIWYSMGFGMGGGKGGLGGSRGLGTGDCQRFQSNRIRVCRCLSQGASMNYP